MAYVSRADVVGLVFEAASRNDRVKVLLAHQNEILDDCDQALAVDLHSHVKGYFDSITQLQLDTWSRGRVTLVGDAGYCPGPAVGGSTSLAVIGAYVLAGELAAAGGDYERAYAAYEREMNQPVRQSRAFALGAAKTIPRSKAGVWTLSRGAQLISALPAGLTRAIAKMNTKGVRMHDSIRVKEYHLTTVA